nr:MAG TPA: hypothetical protein [Caudoviricetes sp.]
MNTFASKVKKISKVVVDATLDIFNSKSDKSDDIPDSIGKAVLIAVHESIGKT